MVKLSLRLFQAGVYNHAHDPMKFAEPAALSLYTLQIRYYR